MNYTICNADGEPFEGSLDGAEQVNFGKTKKVFKMPNGSLGIGHEDVITAFDNPDFTGDAPGKGVMSAYSTAVLFKQIEAAGVRTTHKGFINSNTTSEEPLEMLPFEIIWRRYNVEGNSWDKRNPGEVPVGERYEEIKYEVGIKSSVIDTKTGEECTDPFMILDDNFEPLLNAKGLPRLTHQKTGKEITYDRIVNPNTKQNVSSASVREAIDQYKLCAAQIREMTETVQQVTFDTYAQVGRVNADGKIEVGLDSEGRLTLGDELELDSVRNVSLRKVEIDGEEYEYPEDLLGRDLNEVIEQGAGSVTRIVEARHSSKQAYRGLVKPWGDFPMSSGRRVATNLAASEVTGRIYGPTAMALSERFSKEVGYTLSKAA